MKNKTNVLIVDDHVVVREGFVALVNAESDMKVCGQAESASGAMELVVQERPDVVVVDLILKDGDGLELIKSIHVHDPRICMLVVSMQDEEIYAERALRAGALGYIMKYAATEEFIEAIRAVSTGQIHISRKMNARILHEFAGDKKNSGTESGENIAGRLTDRELEVFQLIGSGLPTRGVADRLGISVKTVESHRENIKLKLGLESAIQLIQAALQWVQQKPRD